MEKNISTLTDTATQFALEVNYTALINCYCREFTNWSRYWGIPRYDAAIGDYFKKSGYEMHIRIDFTAIGYDVYIPLKYYSESNRHLFEFPVIKRELTTDSIQEISIVDFMNLTVQYAQTLYHNIDAATVLQRLDNSIDNLSKYLQFIEENEKLVNHPVLSFIEAEQSLILGHIVHPVPKSKQGFTAEDLMQYSPETEGKFQLHYFLVHPDCCIEKNADGPLVSQQLKVQLIQNATADDLDLLHLINQYPDYVVVPMHPWEAGYLLRQTEVIAMQEAELVLSLGLYGDYFSATSSVRTVYNEDSDWMFKFSLHVKITNSERINLFPELYRGYDISRLLQTEWGRSLQQDFPEIDFVVDPAFIAVTYKDKVINGFNISIRRNPFKGADKDKNVTLLAALCQDGILGQPSRLANCIVEASVKKGKSIEQTAYDWFKQYLHICIRPIVGILNQYGLACEFHQQNVMVELDANGFPAKLYFRDNQGFFFREGRKKRVTDALPGIADLSQSFIDEVTLAPKYTYYLVTNNIMGVINAFGCNGLIKEEKLINLVYKEFKSLEKEDETGLVDYIINSRTWSTKANLITSLQNINEADESLDYPAVFLECPNPLNWYFFCPNLIQPKTKEVVYSRYFEAEDITISIRPFDFDRDFEMIHEWFNRDHARPIWKMDGPARNLELWFRTILPSDETHSFIGEINGVPNFCFEPYWPMRDLVGAYYTALPTDYGTHFFVAATDKDKKYSFQSFQVALDWIFAQPEVGKCIGEASVDAIAMDKLIAKLGYQREGIIEMPHKTAYLTFCTRESYWDKCPEGKNVSVKL